MKNYFLAVGALYFMGVGIIGCGEKNKSSSKEEPIHEGIQGEQNSGDSYGEAGESEAAIGGSESDQSLAIKKGDRSLSTQEINLSQILKDLNDILIKELNECYDGAEAGSDAAYLCKQKAVEADSHLLTETIQKECFRTIWQASLKSDINASCPVIDFDPTKHLVNKEYIAPEKAGCDYELAHAEQLEIKACMDAAVAAQKLIDASN